jgi:signal transduction histidine kinase/PAS domain-containing protein
VNVHRADAEIRALRTVLRDLVALSAIPVAWIGREPAAVAAGLVDVLTGLLRLDFVFVRLCVPGVDGAVDVTRGNAWKTFPEWLEKHLAESGWFSSMEVIPDVGGGGPYRGVVIPVGINGEGMVAAACDRAGFPTETDQLLLRLAANHAATAFQSAALVHERMRAEKELRQARDELEMKVAERTAELRTSEAYLSEAQRLTHTGTAALDGVTGEVIHSSDEHSRLYGFDPEQGVPSFEEFRRRVHPEDRAAWTESLKRGMRKAAAVEGEFRVVPPGGPLRHLRAIVHPVFAAGGELAEFVGTVVDVTESRRAREEHRAQLWFLESMDAIDRVIQGTSDLEQMMGDVLDVVLATFRCDRAWLVYPYDPAVDSHQVRIERTRPEYVGASGTGVGVPDELEVARLSHAVLGSSSPVRFDPESERPLPPRLAERFGIKSMIAMAVHPKVDKPYMFGLHQCSRPRIWTPQEERLFHEIGRRLADALNTLLMFRNLRESQRKLEASRAELAASRARIVTAADQTRRRIERDLHDGVQQRLVSLTLAQRGAEAMVPPELPELQAQLSRVADGLAGALEELQEISRGIHPAILAQGGLAAALKILARRSAVPVELEVRAGTRLPEPVEVAAYYIVSEALTNTAKHAHASAVHVAVEARDGILGLSIRDDGRGGADPARGSGLIGLTDRVDALGGTIEVASPVGAGTTLLIRLPIDEG